MRIFCSRPFFMLLIISGLLLNACKKEEDPVNFHFDYFALEQGRYVIYEVLEIKHDHVAGVHDTLRYQLKAQWGDTVIDNEGRIAREYIRSVYNTVTGSYTPKDLWTGIIDGNRAELVEENQRQIKLVFSPSKYKEWNVNAFNAQGTLNAYYTNLHEPFSINGNSFDSTVRILQDSVYNLVQYKRRYELYAKGVGLIFKRNSDLTISNFDTLVPQKGSELYLKLIGYGK